MGKFEQYNIPLKGRAVENADYQFTLDNNFFKKIDSPEVQRGNVEVKLQVVKRSSIFEFFFELDGVIQIPCNRCLDDMDQAIYHKDTLQVKLGSDFSDDGETVTVPESDNAINIAWFLYEFVVINIPIKHNHAPGECNKTMMSKLKQHVIKRKDDDDGLNDMGFDDDNGNNDFTLESETDPRWDGLKNIFENN